MDLQYLGHSCFLVKTSTGRRILLDPFDESIGYTPYIGATDLILISHSHFDHNTTKYYSENIKIINTPITYECDYCYIEGFNSYHDKLNGLKRGNNIIFVINVDGLRICHLGDLGHIPDSSLLEKLGNIDILMIPIGGNYTLDAKEATTLCNLLKSTYIVPIHYLTYNLSYQLDDLTPFIISMKNIIKLDSNILASNSLDWSLPTKSNLLLFSI